MKMKKATPEALEALAERCKGFGGGQETECNLTFEGWNPDWVEVGGTRKLEVAKVIERCGSAVLGFWENEHSVTLRVARKHPETGKRVFRGFQYAFSPVDISSAPFPGQEEKKPPVLGS